MRLSWRNSLQVGIVIAVVLGGAKISLGQQILQYNNRYNSALLQTMKKEFLSSPESTGVTKWISLSFADSKWVADMLKVHFPSLLITNDPRLKGVSLTGDPENIKKASKLIVHWDQPVTQFKFEVKVVEVNSLFLEANQSAFSTLLNAVQVQFNAQENKVVGPNGLQAVLSFLIQNGQGKLVAKPTITTLDGNRATLKVGDKIPYITQTVHEHFITEEMHQVEAGLELEILPKLATKNQVLTEISAAISGIKLWRVLGTTEYPVLSTRKAETKVMLKPGETLILAGLYDEQEKTISGGVPWLKDLPIIGGWFTQNQKELVHNDILFFITPTWGESEARK